MDRFNFDANTIADAREYMIARSRQLLRHGYFLVNINEFEWGISAYFEKDTITYQSIFMLKDYRGKRLYKPNVTNTILTSNECDLKFFLYRNSIPYVAVELCESEEYRKIQKVYGDAKAKRSDVHLINHIDEGLYILNLIGASEVAKRAYCLHPIVQGDKDLKNYLYDLPFHPVVCMTAVEYRSVANEYLSLKDIATIKDIRLSPLKDVNDMLIADKMQNRKDFDLYHNGTHDRSSELNKYFDNWFKRLGITSKMYDEFFGTMNQIEKWNFKK
jgi:hypothetical protein